MKVKLQEMTWPEVEEALKKPHAVILVVGSTEQHGPHLPLNVDDASPTYVALEAAKRVTEEHGIHVLVAPNIHYGEVTHFRKFPGTIGLSPDTLIRVVSEIVRSFVSQGFKNVIVLNGHLENVHPIALALREVHIESPSAGLFGVNWHRLGFDTWSKIRKGGPTSGGHGCEKETAVSLFLQPENVHLDKIDMVAGGWRSWPLPEKYLIAPNPPTGRVFYFSRTKGERKFGIMGDPSAATKETGEKFLAAVVEDFIEIILEVVKSEGNVIKRTPEYYDQF